MKLYASVSDGEVTFRTEAPTPREGVSECEVPELLRSTLMRVLQKREPDLFPAGAMERLVQQMMRAGWELADVIHPRPEMVMRLPVSGVDHCGCCNGPHYPLDPDSLLTWLNQSLRKGWDAHEAAY